jgi:WhiB family transcriptional regulator, redox-sensing transcriptional regulator
MNELRGKPLIARGRWRQFAACRSTDTELFFPASASGPSPGQADEAKAICARCRVRRQCLAFAMLTGQQHGIWGGLTEDECRAAARRSRAALQRPHTGDRRAVAWDWMPATRGTGRPSRCRRSGRGSPRDSRYDTFPLGGEHR